MQLSKHQSETVYVLKSPRGSDDDLDGYVFADAKHAQEWIDQPLMKGSGASIVRVEATSSSRRCACCGAIHWRMMWRGKLVRVSGAWSPPKTANEPVDDGEE